MIHLVVRTISLVIAIVTCLYLAKFFWQRWEEPTFRAFTMFFGFSTFYYVGLLVATSLVDFGDASFVQWRASIFLASNALILMYLVGALRKSGRRSP